MSNAMRKRRIKVKTVADGDLPLPEVMIVPVSFETNEQTVNKIYFPFAVTIEKLRGQVTKAIAASDDGTVTAANATGDMATGVLTFTASDAINHEVPAVEPTTNNTIAVDSYLQLTVVKSTAGGKANIAVEYIRSA
jgi:hypothetical protein